MAVALAGAAPASQPTASFRSAGAEFTLQLPAGFCTPKDMFIDVAQTLASMDSENVTLFTAFQCGAEGLRGEHPLIIKTPKTALLTRLQRAELTEALKNDFNKPDFSALFNMSEVVASTNEAVNDVLKSDSKLEMQVKPLGQDAVCNYLGGSIALDGKLSAIVSCLTVVDQRLLSIYMYSDYAGAASVSALLKRTRAVADDLIARNEAR